MRFFAAFLALAALLVSAPALAQIERDEPSRTLNLDGKEVEGTLQKPTDKLIQGRWKREFASHIKLRTSFDRELNASTDKL